MLSASMAASSDSFVSAWAVHRVMAWSASASSTSRAGESGVQRCHLVEPESSFLPLGSPLVMKFFREARSYSAMA